jgi:hypothetical protein
LLWGQNWLNTENTMTAVRHHANRTRDVKRFDAPILIIGVEAPARPRIALEQRNFLLTQQHILNQSSRPTRHRIDLDVRHNVNRVKCDCHIPCVVGSDVLRLRRLHYDLRDFMNIACGRHQQKILNDAL